MAHHLFILAVQTDGATAGRIESGLQSLLTGEGVGPAVCDWAPDHDTVADGLHADYDDLVIHDLNPASPF